MNSTQGENNLNFLDWWANRKCVIAFLTGEAWAQEQTISPLKVASTPQRSNAARVRNMSRFNGGKLPGNSKHYFKKSKDKAVPGKRSFKL